MDAELYLKMAAKEDPEWEKKIAEWVEVVLEDKLSSKDLSVSLKSGVMLCRLVNKLRPGIISKFNNSEPIHPLMEVENINLYLKACWRLGVPSSDLFSVADLHMARGMPSVLQNLASLSRIAKNSLGWDGEIVGPNINPNRDNPTRHWEVNIPGKVNVVDLIDDGTESLVEVRNKLQLAQAHAQDLQNQLASLKSENELLKATGGLAAATADGSGGGGGGANSAASTMQQLFERYKKDMATKNSMLKDLDEQCTQLEQRCKELRLDNEALRRASSAAVNKATAIEEQLKGEIDLLRSESKKQASQYEDQISELKKARDALIQESAKLRATATDGRRDASIATAKLDEEWQAKLKRETAKTLAQLRQLQETNQELEAAVAEIRAENEELRQRASDAESDKSVVIASVQSLKRELENAKEALQSAQASAAATATKSAAVDPEKIAQIEAEWKTRLEERERRHGFKVESLNSDIKSLEAQLQALEKENATLKDAQSDLGSQKESAMAEAAAAAAAARSAADRAIRSEQAIREQLEKSQDEFEAKAKASLEQQSKLRGEVNSLIEERDQLVRSLRRQEESFKQQIEALQTELDAQRRKSSREIETLRSELRTSEQQAEELRRQKADLKRQLDEAEASVAAASTAASTEAEKEELTKELEGLKEELEYQRTKLNRRIKELDDLNSSLQRQILGLDKEARQVRNEAEAKEASLKAEVHAMEEKLSEAKRREVVAKSKYEQSIQEIKEEQEMLSQTNLDLVQSNEQLKKEIEGLRATLAAAAAAAAASSAKRREEAAAATNEMAPPSTPRGGGGVAPATPRGDSTSPSSVRMSLMLPSMSPSPGLSPSPSANSLADINKANRRGSHERQASGPESLSQLSRLLTRRNTTKMDASMQNIKAQLEGGSSPGSPTPDGGQQIFYEQGIDDNVILFCRESLETIIQESGNVVYDDMSQINQLFKFDTGRRLFCFLLQYFANKREKQLTPEGFEVLLFLINSCLNELAAAEVNDFTTVAILMEVVGLFYQRTPNGGGKEYMKDIMKTHFIWQNNAYWEHIFWPQFTKNYREAFGADFGKAGSSSADSRKIIQNKKQREWVLDQLKTTCATMTYWGMTPEQNQTFVETVGTYVGLGADYQKEILENVRQSLKIEESNKKAASSPKDKEKEKDKDTRKSKWF